MIRRVALALSVPLAACVSGTEPTIIVLPSSFGIEASDSLWMACEAVDALQDSAFHFVSPLSSVQLGPGDSASVHVWIEDVDWNRTDLPLRCQGTSSSAGGTQRTGVYDGTSGGVFFTWDFIPIPDTADSWVTSEEVAVNEAFRPTTGGGWTSTLIIKGHALPVLLNPN